MHTLRPFPLGPVRPAPCLALAILALLVAGTSLTAQDRLVRRFTAESGLPPPILALAQDSTGFLWVGTLTGLFRYDGIEFRRWAPDAIPNAVATLTVSPAGRAVAVDSEGRILELGGDGAHELTGRADRSPDSRRVAAFDGEGRLWVVRDGGVAWLSQAGHWEELSARVLEGEQAARVWPAAGKRGVLVATRNGLWEVATDSAPRKLLSELYIMDVISLPDGRVVALGQVGDLVEVDGESIRELLRRDEPIPRGLAHALVERAGTYWIASDRFLTELAAGSPPEVLGPRDGVIAGGPLLVDHEGSLWLGGFTALSQYPEPDTRVWNEHHGLPSAHTRFLARSGDVVWVATWQGAGFLHLRGGRWEAGAVSGWLAQYRICGGDRGVLWIASTQGIKRLRERSVSAHGAEADIRFTGCSPGRDGGLWIASSDGLLHASPGDGLLERIVDAFPFAGENGVIHAVLEDRSGRVWAASHELVCQASGDTLRAGGVPRWSCQELPSGTVHLTSLIELPSGSLWASSNRSGVLSYRDGRWEPLPGNAELPTRSVLNLVPSASGGVWVVGNGILQRVAERPGREGWEVLERLGFWHGLPAIGGGDILEDEDGTIWIATSRGVVRVPRHVRSAAPLPPRVALVDSRVDGRSTALDSAVRLPHDRNRLELRFAALTYRDPSLVRYQVRLSPREAWTDTRSQPSFHWVDLPPGSYRAELRASLDGRGWSAASAALAFEVLPPWHRTPLALLAFALLGAVLLFGAYRARVAYLVGLERERTRIAMDLHDEMGSGLASIGILAGVLSKDGREKGDRGRVAREVEETAEELGTALSDIVWSLDPHSATLEELASRLAEHGNRLFADDVEFDTDFRGAWPPRPLPLPLRRNLLLIGLEALHNAARHARAGRVLLSIHPCASGWELTVEDDGVGLSAGQGPAGAAGRGLRAMRRRAAEIGAEIAWNPAESGQGTILWLRFDLAPGALARLRRLSKRIGRHRALPPSHDHARAETRRPADP